MLVFIDESGDAGFKISKGSSATFVVALVIFDDELEAEETALRIKKLKRELSKSEKFEFKFNKCKRDLRMKFLETVKDSKFHIRAIVFKKEVLYSPHLRTSKDSFYNFALRQVLEHNNKTIKEAKIRLDGLGERSFRNNLVVYLRKHLNSSAQKVMKNLRFRDSKEDVLIQLADMVAGAIRKYYDHNADDWDIYKKVIKGREDDIWPFK